MAKGQPFSVRLDEATEELVAAEARRTRRSRSAVVEAFAEETAKTRRFPGLAFRGDDVRRRAWIIGTGLDVWEIIEMLEDFGSPEALFAASELTPPQVRLAIAYAAAYPDEVRAMIEDNALSAEQLDVLYPFIVRSDT